MRFGTLLSGLDRRAHFAPVVALWIVMTTASFAATSPARVSQETWNPVADPAALVISGPARFTILTPQLIRMEWEPNRQFEDRASLVFVNRRLPVPKFSVDTKGDWLTIKTDSLVLKYKKSSGEFTPENLSVQLSTAREQISWRPGMKDTGNLGGTIRTLDRVKGSTELEPGLVSRDGWVLVDDSERPLFDRSDWPWAVQRAAGKRQDWYFFGYGHDYRQALHDYTRVAGKIPLPPRFAFGSWWSRYWAYTDTELKQLVREFQSHDVPLDVLVIDMDWHLTFGVLPTQRELKDAAGQRKGWTGYTWNPLYFPDPEDFLSWSHQQGLKNTLNLHPASGVQPHEEQYPAMARAMGIDPASKQYVAFDIADKKFATNYMKILHHPLEGQGVDFFWLDWQQEHTTSMAGLNPTWWLNYVHFTDMEREGKRPLIFHRWGGLGNHRYQIGFSGDTISVWDSLAFQPYFTATAANVGYTYWSHDIGGHMPGIISPELYTRWVQWGIFSPILRTHTTKNPDAERRIWAYPPRYANAMRDAFLLRYAMIPYIYTSARETYDSGIGFLHPLYYDWPEVPEAYDYKNQYMFGDRMMIAPVIAAAAAESQLAAKSVWLPPGEWIEWYTGTHIEGPAKLDRSFTLEEIPVYVKAGSIIPMQPPMSHVGEKPVDPLVLYAFPLARSRGRSESPNEFRLYEDAGNDLGYEREENTWTTIRQTLAEDGTLQIEVEPESGSYRGMVQGRAYEIHLPVALPPKSVVANGAPIPYSRDERVTPSWRYDGEKLETIISTPTFSTNERVQIEIEQAQISDADTKLLDGARGRITRLKNAMDQLNTAWPKGWSPDLLIEAAQTGDRMSIHPERAPEELRALDRNWTEVIRQVAALQVDPKLVDFALRQLGTTLQEQKKQTAAATY